MTERVYESPLREEQAAATRERILRGMRELVLEGHTTNVTMADVAKRARVSERTVYRHYPAKEDLFQALFAWAVTDGQEYDPGDPAGPGALVSAAEDMFPRFESNAEIVRAMNAGPEARALRAARAEQRRHAVRRAMAPVTEGLAPDSATRLHAIVHLLTSSDGFLFMQEFWGLDSAEAVKAVRWAVAALADRAVTKKGAP
jgi:AcrR family transcriptional regulator